MTFTECQAPMCMTPFGHYKHSSSRNCRLRWQMETLRLGGGEAPRQEKRWPDCEAAAAAPPAPSHCLLSLELAGSSLEEPRRAGQGAPHSPLSCPVSSCSVCARDRAKLWDVTVNGTRCLLEDVLVCMAERLT